MRVVVVIPANNETGFITACLQSLLEQTDAPGMYVIVSANACRDDTVAVSQGMAPEFVKRGHELIVIDSPEPGKPGAINRAEAAIPEHLTDAARIYLDADVRCAPALIGQIAATLQDPAPRYATGVIEVTRSNNAFSRAYTEVWIRLPFVKQGTVGAGFFAVNSAGRGMWGVFPDIISDDTFVRLQFTPDQRIEVPALYFWPMVEGFSALVRVRRRQNAGVQELARLYPGIMNNEAKVPLGLKGAFKIAATRPFGFLGYVLVQLAVRAKTTTQGDWSRGR